jgi:hypothetical protein
MEINSSKMKREGFSPYKVQIATSRIRRIDEESFFSDLLIDYSEKVSELCKALPFEQPRR